MNALRCSCSTIYRYKRIDTGPGYDLTTALFFYHIHYSLTMHKQQRIYALNQKGRVLIGRLVASGNKLVNATTIETVQYWVPTNETRFSATTTKRHLNTKVLVTCKADSIGDAMAIFGAKRVLGFTPMRTGANLVKHNDQFGIWEVRRVVFGDYVPGPNEMIKSIAV